MIRLTEQFHVPEQHHRPCDRLTALVETHTRRLLAEEYWNDTHLDAISDHSGQFSRLNRARDTLPDPFPI